MSEQCPNCLSTRIGKNNYGKKTAGVVGASIGAYSGFTAVAAGALSGAAMGIKAGPVGGLGGAVIGAFVGGASGATAGVVFGDVLDDYVLDNQRCLACGYSFTADLSSENDIR